jgi:nucleoside-diphosphate-sugar epimerase
MREATPPRRVLLTGATGTVGRLLLPALASTGASIRVLVNQHAIPSDAPPLEEIRRGDVTRPATLAGIAEDCDVVIHAAARPEFGGIDRERRRRINVDGTRAVLREAGSAGAKTFVLVGYAGTVQERGPTEEPVDEETPPEPGFGSETVRTLFEAEALVLEANRPGDMRTMVVSPGTIAEPGFPTFLGGLLSAFLAEELPYRLLDEVRVAPSGGADIGSCVTGAIARGRGGRRYFATGDCVRLGEIYDRLAAESGVPPPKRRLPDLLVEELGLLTPVLPLRSFLRRLVLPRELVLHLQRLAPVRNSRTRAELGFTPRPLSEILAAFARFERALQRATAGAAG